MGGGLAFETSAVCCDCVDESFHRPLDCLSIFGSSGKRFLDDLRCNFSGGVGDNGGEVVPLLLSCSRLLLGIIGELSAVANDERFLMLLVVSGGPGGARRCGDDLDDTVFFCF